MTDEELHNLLDEATPGPWRIHDCQSYGERRLNFFQEVWSDDTNILVTTEVTRAHGDGGRANMRLIAAAPDLAAEVLRLREVERAAERLAEALEAGAAVIADTAIGPEFKNSRHSFTKDARAVLVAYRYTKEGA